MVERNSKIADSHLDVRTRAKTGEEHLMTGLQEVGFEEVLSKWTNEQNRERVKRLLVKLNVLSKDPDKKFTDSDRQAIDEAQHRTETHLRELEDQLAELEMFGEADDETKTNDLQKEITEAQNLLGFIEVVRENLFPEETEAPVARAQVTPETQDFNANAFEAELVADQRFAFWTEITNFVPQFPVHTELDSRYPGRDDRIRPGFYDRDPKGRRRIIQDDLRQIDALIHGLEKYISVDLAGYQLDPIRARKKDHIETHFLPYLKQVQVHLQTKNEEYLLTDKRKEVQDSEAFKEAKRLIAEINSNLATLSGDEAADYIEQINNLLSQMRTEVITQAALLTDRTLLETAVQADVATLEGLISTLEERQYELWEQDILHEVANLENIRTRTPRTLLEFQQNYDDLTAQLEILRDNRDQFVQRLPSSRQNRGQVFLDRFIDAANNRLSELVRQQWDRLTLIDYGPLTQQRQDLDDVTTAANRDRNATDIDPVLRPHEQNLVQEIDALARAIRGVAATLIIDNRNALQGWINDITNDATEALTAIRQRITDLENQDVENRRTRVLRRIQDILDLVLNTDADFQGVTIDQLETMKREMRNELSLSNLNASDFNQYSFALQKIDGYLEERKRPKYMNFEELAAEIDRLNLDVYKHELFQSTSTDPQKLEAYQRYHALAKLPTHETDAERRERVDYKVLVQLRTLQNELQYEGSKASCKRSTLFPELEKRQVDRTELLEATTCHPEYGMEIRTLLQDMIQGATDRRGRIAYTELIKEGAGRTILESHIKSLHEARLQARYDNETVKRIFDLSFLLFYSHTLLDVAFAELQKQTATRGHNPKDEDLDRVLLTRMDAALVHRITRYSKYADWSGWLTVYFDNISQHWHGENDPNSIGSTPENNHILAEIQERLLAYERAHFDTDTFEGQIPFSSLFEPIFADTYQLLLPAKACAGFGEKRTINDRRYQLPEFIVTEGKVYGHDGLLGDVDQEIDLEVYDLETGAFVMQRVSLPDKSNIQDRSQYLTAEGSWMKIIELDLKEIPFPVTEQMILEKEPEGSGMGYVDLWIDLAGKAKMFPGRHLEYCMVPMLTHLIQRLFAYCRISDEDRVSIFQEVVKKIRQASQGGLKDYKPYLLQVIENISDPVTLNAHAHRGEMTSSVINRLDYTKFKAGRALQYILRPNTNPRRAQREAYMNIIWKEKNFPKPWRESVNFTPLAAGRDKDRRYWAIVDNNASLPEPGVNRKGELKEHKGT